MVSHAMALLKDIELQYASHGDLSFARILREFDVGNDEEALAELIEADGRARIALSKHVELSRYLDAVRDLDSKSVALDAAIDVSLRCLSASSRPTGEAVQTLIENYPHLADSIREAASLAEALWSTTGLRRRLTIPPRALPVDFGPRLRSGEHRYQLRRLLGKGGWGEVYLALDRQLCDSQHEALVAIKVLTGMERGPWARQRLMDEAAKARRVDHPNVVRVLDRGVSSEDEDFIVYEFIEGGDLGAWGEERDLVPKRAALLVAKIARGVQAAHAAGLVHCDLKPGNVLMTISGEPRVADFGIAVRAGQDLDAIREHDDGRPVGNVAFISPEQFRMEPGSLTIASDIYALGGMLFFLLTKRFPNGSTTEEVARTHNLAAGRGRAPGVRGLAKGVDQDLESICRKAMDPTPQVRYASAAEMADDLERWTRHEPVECRRAGPLRRASLLYRRRPVVSSLAAVATLLVCSAVLLARHWSTVADRESQRLARASAGVEKAANLGSAFNNVRHVLFADGVDLDLTPQVIAVEWVTGVSEFGNPLDPDQPWKNRIPRLQTDIRQQEKKAGGSTLTSLIYKTELGRCLLNVGRSKEAEPVLDQAVEQWHQHFTIPNDPFVHIAEQMRDVAVVHCLVDLSASRSLSQVEVQRLSTAASSLEPLVQARDVSQNGALRRMAWAAVLAADVPSVLNRPEMASKAGRLIRDWEGSGDETNVNSPTYRALHSKAMDEITAWERSPH